MKRRILLVDDDLAVLLTLKAVLELHGFEVETAGSSAEAFARMESSVYHMVISDLRMETEEAGLEVIRAARRQAYDPATALLTAYPPSGEHWNGELGTENMGTENLGTEKTGPEKTPTRCSSSRSAPAISCVRWRPCSSATPTSKRQQRNPPRRHKKPAAAQDERSRWPRLPRRERFKE